MNKWICENCGDTNMPALYTSINNKKVCNPCSQFPQNKWVGENHFQFAEYVGKEDLFDQDDLAID
jgi:hypothetical protein